MADKRKLNWPSDEARIKMGDCLLVGGTFYIDGKLVLENGVTFPVDIELKISSRGVTFPKVKLKR